MAKKYSRKFWIIFWLTSIVFLTGWFYFWQIKNQGVGSASSLLGLIPAGDEQKQEWRTMLKVADYMLQKDGKERTFLVLMQNNLEIRPGGGYIGTFGILKVKNGSLASFETHDLSNFDGRIPDTVEPPYPMKETLRIPSWKLRDSNYSPDFPTNALKAEEFYHMGQGQEQFDGVFAVTANVLTSLLTVTGPITVPGYPGTFNSDSAILSLEYQVEKGFNEQGIERGDRKMVMKDLAQAIMEKLSRLTVSEKLDAAKMIVRDLNQKDIQLYFHDPTVQQIVAKSNWGGITDATWDKDYLMAVDANLGAYKSDYYVKRSIDYSVNLAGDVPRAHLKITYQHTAKQKDWMTKDYLTYLRVYTQDGSWLTKWTNTSDPKFGTEFGKKYFGVIVKVPLGTTKTIELDYTLPKNFTEQYDLKVQKQAGINDVPFTYHFIDKQGTVTDFTTTLNGDFVASDLWLK